MYWSPKAYETTLQGIRIDRGYTTRSLIITFGRPRLKSSPLLDAMRVQRVERQTCSQASFPAAAPFRIRRRRSSGEALVSLALLECDRRAFGEL